MFENVRKLYAMYENVWPATPTQTCKDMRSLCTCQESQLLTEADAHLARLQLGAACGMEAALSLRIAVRGTGERPVATYAAVRLRTSPTFSLLARPCPMPGSAGGIVCIITLRLAAPMSHSWSTGSAAVSARLR